MSTIEVVNHVTLDGVMQAPAHPDEDRRGGFEHGGWAVPYQDEVQGEYMGARMGRGGGALLLGRWTYEKFEDAWQKQPQDNPIRQVLEASTKYVVSRSARELGWQNSVLLQGDAVEVVQRRARERAQRFVGRTLDVLVEGTSRTDAARLRGRTRHNKVVNFSGLAGPGDLFGVEIHEASSQTLRGEEQSFLLARAV